MDGKVIFITIKRYEDRLVSLRQQEKDMKNPLLREWFSIRNQIRKLERQIREMKNGKIDRI
jgi:hypothetical protein